MGICQSTNLAGSGRKRASRFGNLFLPTDYAADAGAKRFALLSRRESDLGAGTAFRQKDLSKACHPAI